MFSQSTEKATEVIKPTETQKTIKTQKPVHSHSYSKKAMMATCTETGFTTYTCSCGDTYRDNYSNSSHDFYKFKYTNCGTIDKSHSYEYLIEWIKENGSTYGSKTEVNYVSGSDTYSLQYSAQYNNMIVNRSGSYGSSFTFTSLHLDTIFTERLLVVLKYVDISLLLHLQQTLQYHSINTMAIQALKL